MIPFKASQIKEEGILHLSMEGEIQATCDFPILNLDGIKKLDLDIGKVTYINSGGIRNWIVWIVELNKNYPHVDFVFQQIPPIIISQISNIDSFIPKKSKIKSVYIPFFCDHCGASASRLFEPQQYFEAAKSKTEIIAAMSDMSCPKCTKPMEIDAFPDKYLTCLERHRSN